jgi:hypothetical protein
MAATLAMIGVAIEVPDRVFDFAGDTYADGTAIPSVARSSGAIGGLKDAIWVP